jgi:hypothetical protein
MTTNLTELTAVLAELLSIPREGGGRERRVERNNSILKEAFYNLANSDDPLKAIGNTSRPPVEK